MKRKLQETIKSFEKEVSFPLYRYFVHSTYLMLLMRNWNISKVHIFPISSFNTNIWQRYKLLLTYNFSSLRLIYVCKFGYVCYSNAKKDIIIGTRQDPTLGTEICRNNSFIELFIPFQSVWAVWRIMKCLLYSLSQCCFYLTTFNLFCHASWPLLLK